MGRVNDSRATLAQARELRLRDGEASLRKLGRQLAAARARHEELAAAHRAADHANQISALDTRKFRIAKAASDLETDAERLSSRLADLSARLTELELQGAEGGVGGGAAGGPGGEGGSTADLVEDEVLLRLKVYRSLGIEVERDAEGGDFARAVVRNDRKGDVHVVNLDKKFSRFFYANYFWQTL